MVAATEIPTNPIEAIFIDCDDCLYQNDWSTAKKITSSIAAYVEKLGVSKEKSYDLYKQHGTCLKGLLVEGIIDDAQVGEFLHEVHQIDYSDIKEDPALFDVLKKACDVAPCWIFTASAKEHAERCLERIGLSSLPWKGIIDTRDCGLDTKHTPSSFKAAMRIAGVSEPSNCLFCDDSVKNIVAAKQLGWRTVLVGLYDRDHGTKITCPEADAHIASLHALEALLKLNTSDASAAGANAS